jgi:hypothetical protein
MTHGFTHIYELTRGWMVYFPLYLYTRFLLIVFVLGYLSFSISCCACVMTLLVLLFPY